MSHRLPLQLTAIDLLMMDNHKQPSASVSVFASDILTNDLLYDLILWYSTPATLMRLARTCRSAHAAVQSHFARSFNINDYLLRYFTDPLAFRSLQAHTRTLISGSSAIQFLDRTFYPEADLDLYCHHDTQEQLGRYLIDQEKYTFSPNRSQSADFHIAVTEAKPAGEDIDGHPYAPFTGVSAVYTFTKDVKDLAGPNRTLKVQLIAASNTPMETILSFHSSMYHIS
jgi:hypothetical protein